MKGLLNEFKKFENGTICSSHVRTLQHCIEQSHRWLADLPTSCLTFLARRLSEVVEKWLTFVFSCSKSGQPSPPKKRGINAPLLICTSEVTQRVITIYKFSLVWITKAFNLEWLLNL